MEVERAVGSTPFAPQPAGHYSQAVRAGDVVWTAGLGGYDPSTRRLVGPDIESQTRQALANLAAALAACGASMGDVLRVGVYLADLGDRDRMNLVYAEYWPDDPPARTTLGVALAGGAKIQIDAMAIVDRVGTQPERSESLTATSIRE